MCAICNGVYDYLLRRRVVMTCGHAFHADCIKQAITQAQSSDKTLCPICRQPTSTLEDAQIQYQKFISKYAITDVSSQKKFFQIQCSSCNAEFTRLKHPIGYQCNNCGGVRCREMQEVLNVDLKDYK